MMKVKIPGYYEKFQCIGASCEDNCCIGWDVDIDKETYKKYRKTENETLKPLFNKYLEKREEVFSDDVDYGYVKLSKEKRCAFLTEGNLCVIQKELGEEALSNVCGAYPRVTNSIDGVLETSLNVSCPEAARIILLSGHEDRKRLTVESEKPFEDKLASRIMSYTVDTKSEEYKDSLERHLAGLRDISSSILESEDISLGDRLLILGSFMEGVGRTFVNAGSDNVQKVLDRYKSIMVKGELYSEHEEFIGALGSDFELKINIPTDILEALDTFNTVDSLRYVSYFREYVDGICQEDVVTDEYGEMQIHKTVPDKYTEAYEAVFKGYEKRFDQILTNYLLNFMAKELFPFSDAQDIFDSYTVLTLRYILIKHQLIGIAGKRGYIDDGLVVDFIQTFSKTVEHHKSFLVNVLNFMIENEMNTMSYVAALVLSDD